MVLRTRSKHRNNDSQEETDKESSDDNTETICENQDEKVESKNFISINPNDLCKRPANYTFPPPYDNIVRTSLSNFDELEIYRSLGNLTAITENEKSKLIWTPPPEESKRSMETSCCSFTTDTSQSTNRIKECERHDRKMMEELLKNLNIPHSTPAKRMSLINHLFK
ncbi:hypothetical protein SNEBB_010325 [Seison nebaliae]|nr:hypothetical protein SNEBB_010325 [Seison nebaliae]